MTLTDDHARLTSAVGLVDLPPRTLIELTGGDRTTYLHNLATADVNALAPGAGRETFLTNARGKIVGHGILLATEETILLETVPDQADALLPHLDRYVIAADVELHDRSGDQRALYLAGPDAAPLLAPLLDGSPPEANLAHVAGVLAGRPVRVVRVDWTDPGGSGSWLLLVAGDDLETVRGAITDAGGEPCGYDAFDAARIEAGTPWYGLDVTSENLPQEVGRDARAISFTKGCYLGQETVARIDALGHVNRLLVGVRFDHPLTGPDVPPAGTELRDPSAETDKPIGHVTSATFSPRLDAPLALAYIRRGHDEPGTPLQGPVGPAEVVALPVTPQG